MIEKVGCGAARVNRRRAPWASATARAERQADAMTGRARGASYEDRFRVVRDAGALVLDVDHDAGSDDPGAHRHRAGAVLFGVVDEDLEDLSQGVGRTAGGRQRVVDLDVDVAAGRFDSAARWRSADFGDNTPRRRTPSA